MKATQTNLPFKSKLKRTAQEAGFEAENSEQSKKQPKLSEKQSISTKTALSTEPNSGLLASKPKITDQNQQSKSLKSLLEDYTLAEDFCAFFDRISEQYLNHTLMYIRNSAGVEKYFRVCEIEFYLNCKGHPDSFTHGDTLQKQNSKWYFHKMGGAYKSGSYKGLDVSFGKPDIGAVGGILLRSLMPVTVENLDGKLIVSGGSKDAFIEGPCNCVNRILEETCIPSAVGIKELVEMPEFCLDAFDSKSNFHLVCENVQMTKREIFKSPRVGLTLKKMDENKPGYWLADYRCVSHPEFHQKMKDFIILSMIKQEISFSTISVKANCKIPKIEELKGNYDKGLVLESTMIKEHKENMKAADWAQAYGLHKKLYKQ